MFKVCFRSQKNQKYYVMKHGDNAFIDLSVKLYQEDCIKEGDNPIQTLSHLINNIQSSFKAGF